MYQGIEDILQTELNNLKDEIIRNHEAAGQKASGETERSLESIVNGTSGKLLGKSYFGVLERGRYPSGLPANIIEILTAWMNAKGLTPPDGMTAEIWANHIKWKLIREGSSLYRSGGRDDIFTDPINAFPDRVAKKLAIFFEAEITNKIFR